MISGDFARHETCHARSALRPPLLASRHRPEARGIVRASARRGEHRGLPRYRSRLPFPAFDRRPAQPAGHRQRAAGRHRHHHRPRRPPPAASVRQVEPALPRLPARRDRRAGADLLPGQGQLAGKGPARGRDGGGERQGRLVQRPPLHGASRLHGPARRGRQPALGRAGARAHGGAYIPCAAQGRRSRGRPRAAPAGMDRRGAAAAAGLPIRLRRLPPHARPARRDGPRPAGTRPAAPCL